MADKIDLKTSSYILGIISIVGALFMPLATLVFGIIGLVQSNKSKSKRSKTLNIVGIILSALAIVVSIYVTLNSGVYSQFPTA